ncbi:hypothetical protein ACTFIZ_004213, partial [Dictyostelium cf. discoideum]
SLLGYLH